VFWKSEKKLLEEKGRVVNQENLNELRGFSTAVPAHFLVFPLVLVLIADSVFLR